jgi:predicted RNA binding protein YcfA (HicA-like mRNA interferase family)
MTSREMLQRLRANGFVEINSNGSHRKLRNLETGRQVIVPVHAKDLKKGTEQQILKDAGLCD